MVDICVAVKFLHDLNIGTHKNKLNKASNEKEAFICDRPHNALNKFIIASDPMYGAYGRVDIYDMKENVKHKT